MIQLHSKAFNFIKKETPTQVFPCEFCEISKEIYFTEDLQTTASVFFQKKYMWMCSVKACSEKFLKTYEEPLPWVLILCNDEGPSQDYYKEKTPWLLFSCEFSEFYQNNYSTEQFWRATSNFAIPFISTLYIIWSSILIHRIPPT